MWRAKPTVWPPSTLRGMQGLVDQRCIGCWRSAKTFTPEFFTSTRNERNRPRCAMWERRRARLLTPPCIWRGATRLSQRRAAISAAHGSITIEPTRDKR